MKIGLSILVINCVVWHIYAQEQIDSIKTKQLNEVIVTDKALHDLDRLPELNGNYIWSGKKNEVINIQSLDANIVEKTPRQIFAKIPGVFVYDMDGAGNQLNISTRGLDPHRGWEFNIRKNGVITNSDMYGYPASHYSMPMEAVEKIELVRGTGSLQYGAQFGGMLNYVAKSPDTTKAFTFENNNSIGSFGLLSTYNAIGGKMGKFQYYTYYCKRKSEGYRANSQSDYEAQSFILIYTPTSRIKLTAELSRSAYTYHIPGPLTDSMFYANPRQSTRSRNYFNPDIIIPSIKLDWKLSGQTSLVWTTSAVLGNRNSVQFDRPATVKDAFDPATLQQEPRQVDIDNFNSYTTELRVMHQYAFANQVSALAVGIQYMNNDLHRTQLGRGTSGSDFDLTLIQPGWGRDLHFKTTNMALFAENNFHLTSNLSVNPGIRIEMGQSDVSGTIKNYGVDDIPNTIKHGFPLLGINSQYQLKRNQQLYGGWSQSYRPVIFKDIIPVSLYEKVDKNLKDADGYNLEIGFRGTLRNLRWDVSIFELQYNNRLGSQATYDQSGTFYLYRTNIGSSVTKGIEVFAEYLFPIAKDISLSIFTSTALLDARYQNAQLRAGNTNSDVSNNKIESVPDLITRNGITIKSNRSSITFLYSYTSNSFADPLNTIKPSANGAVGIVPAYGLLDINASFRISEKIKLRFNINNVFNLQYFTKRPTFYPGPGVWSSDGRSISASVGIKI